jgi:hypothetical protein
MPSQDEELSAAVRVMEVFKREINLKKAQQEQAKKNEIALVRDEKIRAEGFTFDDQNHKISHWDKVRKIANKFTEISGQNNFVQWETGAGDIFAAMVELAAALHHTPMAPLAKALFGSMLQSIVPKHLEEMQLPDGRIVSIGEYIEAAFDEVVQRPLQEDIKTHIIEKLADKVGIHYFNQGYAITYAVDVNNEGKLLLSAYKDAEAITGNEKDLFETGVKAWLKTHNYSRNDENKFVHDVTNEPLTPQALNDINKDDACGIKAFFAGQYRLNIDLAPSAPTPSL